LLKLEALMDTHSELTLSGVLHVAAPEATHLPLTEALQLSLQAVRLVAENHDRGQVVGVLDAAHLICSSTGALSVRAAGGNPIAPELKRGEMPDRLTDVYALGALMYRLLTGRKVNPSRIIEPPSHFNPAVDSALDELVICALDEDPSERPWSARDLEQRLLDVYAEYGLEDSRSEAVQLIKKVKPPVLPLSDAAPKKKAGAVYTPPARVPDPDATMDHEIDDDEWQPRIDRNPLEKKWLLGGLAVMALAAALLVLWPSGSSKKEPARTADDDSPAQVAAAKPEPKIEVKLVDPPAATAKKAKAPESPKKSTRRARR
jgi:hypothetical protein